MTSPRPFLEPLLTVNGRFNIVKALEVDQAVHVVTLGDAFSGTRFVLVHPPNKSLISPIWSVPPMRLASM